MAEGEEGAVREEVAVRLVLDLAERGGRGPEVGGAGEEPPRVGRQIELGVRSDPARGLGECEEQGRGEDRRDATSGQMPGGIQLVSPLLLREP